MIVGCMQDVTGLLKVPTFYQYLVHDGILRLTAPYPPLRGRWPEPRR